MDCDKSSLDLNAEMMEDAEDKASVDENQEFLSPIEELQDAVQSMKSAFTNAQLQLIAIGLEDKSLYEELAITKTQCQQQSNEIFRLVLSLKSEIITLRETLETTQLIQHGLDSRLQATLLERDLLLDELAKKGAVSQQLRDKLLSCRNNGGNGVHPAAGRSSSGSQSTNDSGVALFLENKSHHLEDHHHHHRHHLHHQDLLLDFNGRGGDDHGDEDGRRRIRNLNIDINNGGSCASSSNSANNLNNNITTNHHNNLFTFSPLHLLAEAHSSTSTSTTMGHPITEIQMQQSSSSHHVQSYLNTLSSHNTNKNTSNNKNINHGPSCNNPTTRSLNPNNNNSNENDYSSLNSNVTESSSTSSNNNINNMNNFHISQTSPGGRIQLAYDSDSSLTVAATKSLTLSTSLSKQCGLELDQHHHPHNGNGDGDEDEEEHDDEKNFNNNSTINNVIHQILNHNNHHKAAAEEDDEDDENSFVAEDEHNGHNHHLNELQTSVTTITTISHKNSNNSSSHEAIEPSSSTSQQRIRELDSNHVKQQVGQYQERSGSGSCNAAAAVSRNEDKDDDDKIIGLSSSSTTTSVTMTEELTYEENQRLRVAKELIETERKYCHTLKTIQDVFATPLKESNILSHRDINTLFPEEVGRMYEEHCQLLVKLEQRILTWDKESSIGDLIEKFTGDDGSNVLRLYTSYVNDFPEVLKIFHKLCRANNEFTSFLKECLEQPQCGGLDLGAFLLTPVQRMPRYILLLKQMLKWTTPSHSDYENITICLNRLRNYLSKLNDSMEHSFQLVTAQIIPQQQQQQQRRRENGNSTSIFEKCSSDKNNANSFSRKSLIRSSFSSESSCGRDDDERKDDDDDVEEKEQNRIMHKIRYKRSASATRSQYESSQSNHCTPRKEPASNGSISSKINKLKSRSKSEWIVCKKSLNDVGVENDSGGNRNGGACIGCSSSHDNQNNKFPSKPKGSTKLNRQLLERSISDSDLNSDAEESEERSRQFHVSKSLHDFNQQHQIQDEDFDWTISEPSLCCSDSRSSTILETQKTHPTKLDSTEPHGGQQVVGKTLFRKNAFLRPFLSQPHSSSSKSQQAKERQLVRIERGSQPDLNQKGKKRVSLRASLKNLFSLKKRGSRTLEISQPISITSTSHWNSFLKEQNSGNNISLNSVIMTKFD